VACKIDHKCKEIIIEEFSFKFVKEEVEFWSECIKPVISLIIVFHLNGM
jgi:hypothetical protein